MKINTAWDEVAEFIAEIDPVRTSKFNPSEKSKARAWELVARSKANTLTESEATELESYKQAEHLMRMAKARALKHLANRKSK